MMADQDTVTAEVQELMSQAHQARTRAYCPYSNFHVGAAVLCLDGSIVTGCNVENVCYGMTVCAERTAIMTAVGQGHRKFTAIAVCCDVKGSFKASCGACRQVMAEFGLDWALYMVKPDKTWKKVDIKDLFPMAFSPEALNEERANVND